VTIHPSEDEVVSYFDKLRTGAGGSDDRRGTLTDYDEQASRRRSHPRWPGRVPSARHGPENPDPLGRGTVLQRYMRSTRCPQLLGRDDLRFESCAGVRRYRRARISYSSRAAHFSWRGKNYNGFTPPAPAPGREIVVDTPRHPIITRGVLLECGVHGSPRATRSRQRNWLPRSRAGREQSPWGCLLDHTALRARAAEGSTATAPNPAGAACLPYLHERDIAVLGMDGIHDVIPSGYRRQT